MSDDLTAATAANSTPTAPAAAPFSDAAAPAPGVVPTMQAVLGTPVPTPPPTPTAGGRRAESTVSSTPVEQVVPQPESAAPVEIAPAPEPERSGELGPELEKFLEQTEQQADKQPIETVIAADTLPTSVPKTLKKPVVILPLSEKELQSGRKKNSNHSVRWLAEWCVRQIKKFQSLLVVYRENE